jgi:hypothetical protein
MASVQEQRRGILLLAFASAVLRIYMPGTVVCTPQNGVRSSPYLLPLGEYTRQGSLDRPMTIMYGVLGSKGPETLGCIINASRKGKRGNGETGKRGNGKTLFSHRKLPSIDGSCSHTKWIA